MNTLPSIGLLIRIKKNMGHLKHSQGGFTLIELIIVVAVLAILIPLTSTLVINSYSYYSDILIINKLSLSADNTLRSVTNDIRKMDQIQNAGDKYLYFTLIGGGERYYRFEGETFQICKGSCVDVGAPVPGNFGDLATNVNLAESDFKFYTEKITDINGIDPGDGSFSYPNQPSSFITPVLFIKVEFQLDSDNMTIPFMTIVRPPTP